jgi:hypothetical protein
MNKAEILLVDHKSTHTHNLPDWITDLRNDVPVSCLRIADDVWLNKEEFISWPTRRFLFMPDTVRVDYYRYSPEQLALIRAAGIKPDTRSNGPAVMAFAIAGGQRPWRSVGRKQWSIHHIYDGQFPASGRQISTRAVVRGDSFTEAAGLVAVYPVADALADELAYFAWLLRYEAFIRFGFDPDGVFTSRPGFGCQDR